jgi:hypothetical protein
MLLNERNQSEKALYCTILTMCLSRKGKTVEITKKRSMVARR